MGLSIFCVFEPVLSDEPRSYSHNAVGLAAADRTQRPVDAAGAEDEDAYPGSFSNSKQPIRRNLPLAEFLWPVLKSLPFQSKNLRGFKDPQLPNSLAVHS